MTSQNQNIEKMEVDMKINSSTFGENSSSIEDQYSPITATTGWDYPLPSDPPASWGIIPRIERVVVKMEEAPLYPNSNIRRSHVKVSYQFPWVREEPRATLLDSLLSSSYRSVPFQLAEAGGKPSLESHQSLFERAKNQQYYWKEIV